MLGVAHLEGEAGRRHPVAGGLDGRGQDVDVLVGQDTGDVREEPGAVQCLDWMATRKTEDWVGAHSTSRMRSGSRDSDSTLTQSLR